MRKCPKCKKYKTVIKYGKAKNGKQRYKCKKCNYQFTRPLRIEYSNKIKYSATFYASLKGFSYAFVAKLLNINSRYKVRYWAQKLKVKQPKAEYLQSSFQNILELLNDSKKNPTAKKPFQSIWKQVT